MDYRLENLSEDDFESLVNTLCQKILGTGVVSFAKGRDGGRDGRFEGKANKYPSESKPWAGKFIIQAKHTSDHQASCSDKTFFENKSSVVKQEIPSIKALKDNAEVDNYLLFTNRKETANREVAVQHIKDETCLSNVDIIGKETLHNWLTQHPEVAKVFGLGKFTVPIEFYEKDIRDVIKYFHDNFFDGGNIASGILDRPPINYKNQINNLSVPYYENSILDDLNRYQAQILNFLHDPINEDYAKYYEETAQELKRVIQIHREEFDNFESIFYFLTIQIMENDRELYKKYRNIIPAFLHFMYYQCDIGRER